MLTKQSRITTKQTKKTRITTESKTVTIDRNSSILDVNHWIRLNTNAGTTVDKDATKTG